MNTMFRYDQDELTELFLGRRITGADREKQLLVLDDGTLLQLKGNDGCGGCAAGNYRLTDLADPADLFDAEEAIVTNVAVDEDDEEERGVRRFQLHIYAGHRVINAATFEGSDGNGWYGTAFWITATGTPADETAEVTLSQINPGDRIRLEYADGRLSGIGTLLDEPGLTGEYHYTLPVRWDTPTGPDSRDHDVLTVTHGDTIIRYS